MSYFTPAYLPTRGRCLSRSPRCLTVMPPEYVSVHMLWWPIPMRIVSAAAPGGETTTSVATMKAIEATGRIFTFFSLWFGCDPRAKNPSRKLGTGYGLRMGGAGAPVNVQD